jgi:hypothetical protein
MSRTFLIFVTQQVKRLTSDAATAAAADFKLICKPWRGVAEGSQCSYLGAVPLQTFRSQVSEALRFTAVS